MRKRLTSTASVARPPLHPLPRDPRTMMTWDASLVWCTLLLLAFGLVMVYSASIATAEASAHTGYRAWYFLVRHAVFVALGLLAAFFTFQVPVKVWRHVAVWFFAAGAVLLIGRDASQIARALAGSSVRVESVGTLDAAVSRAIDIAQPGDVVLLSPACASLDQFRDYTERGRRFAELVKARLAEDVDA